MLLDEGGGTPDVEATADFQSAEPTVHEFVPGRPEQASRWLYVAHDSQIGFSLVVGREAQKSPALIRTVARQTAAMLNADAAVPGVDDIAEDQEVKPLGSLTDVFRVAVSSTSERSSTFLTLKPADMRPDVFAELVGAARADLDDLETEA